ncbi:hypothetical protein H2201_002944 [Coniosporium apollinis]|uniref:Ricin B lectin domain-containing protein n=1 Tax=Coniosporium apollinis TaxID=61459 RepID=A0ABQ9NWS1_9PEZI|nr:hypothetical protein H2201_002944 [Coniosporium apollinis]
MADSSSANNHAKLTYEMSKKFNVSVKVWTKAALVNVQSGTALHGEGSSVTGRARDQSNKDKHQIWIVVFPSMPGAGALLVNEATGGHIVAQGENKPVTLDDSSINDRKGQWHMEYTQEGSRGTKFKNAEFGSCVLDLAAGHKGDGTLVYCYKDNKGKNQIWSRIDAD